MNVGPGPSRTTAAAVPEMIDRRGVCSASSEGHRPTPDDRSFIELVEREHPAVVAAAAMIVGSTAMAEEITQDAFERAYVRWAKVGRMDRPGAWVRRVALNRAISATRRSSTERRVLLRLLRTSPDDRHVATSPVERTVIDGDATGLWSAVRRLPPNQARAVALHYGSDLPLQVVADEMDTSMSSVKSLLHRARTTLRNDRTIEQFEEDMT